jgi:arylsulfatase A-like enzyme
MKKMALGAVAAAVMMVATVATRPARGQEAAAPAAGRPNILLAVADDASWRQMAAHAAYVRTPNFDRVAREGALFRNFFTPVPKCSPSRAAILTGRNPWQLEEAADHFGIFPAKFPVYPDLLERAGYAVGFTGKGWGPGDWQAGGFTRNPAGPAYSDAKLKPPTRGISNNDYAANFRAFLAKRDKGRPFCFWYGGHEPHRPYQPGTGAAAGADLGAVSVPGYLPDDRVVRSDLADYGREVAWFDEQLGRILAALEEAGELDRTIVLVTSDNGMPFPRVKGHVYEDACHLPLAVRWPGVVKAGRVVDDFASMTDLAPTFLEAAGAAGGSAGMTGRSLLPVLRSERSAGRVEAGRDHVLLGRERTDVGRPGDAGYPVRAIRTAEYFYAHNYELGRWPAGNPETGYPDIDDSPTKSRVLQLKESGTTRYYDLAMAKRGAEELYDLAADPDCVNNLAADPKYADVKARLRAQMERELTEQQDPRVLGHGELFDRYEYRGGRQHSWDAVMGKKQPAPPADPASPAGR